MGHYETGMDIDKIRRNVQIRKMVSGIIGLASQLLEEDKAFADRFWEVLAEEAGGKIGKVMVDGGPSFRMNDTEAVHFEDVEVPYGAFKGKKVREVPLSYIFLLTEGDFTRRLIRYVRSQRFQDRQ